MLNVTARKRHKLIAFEKVKDTLAEEVCDDANVIPKVEGVAKMYTLVAVLFVVGCECRKYSELYPRSVSVLLNGANNLDCDFDSSFVIVCLDDFAECALAEELDNRVCEQVSNGRQAGQGKDLHLSVSGAFSCTM